MGTPALLLGITDRSVRRPLSENVIGTGLIDKVLFMDGADIWIGALELGIGSLLGVLGVHSVPDLVEARRGVADHRGH